MLRIMVKKNQTGWTGTKKGGKSGKAENLFNLFFILLRQKHLWACHHQTEINHYIIITELPDSIFDIQHESNLPYQRSHWTQGVLFHETAYSRQDVTSRDVLERCENMNGLILNSSALFKNVLLSLSSLNSLLELIPK